MYEMLTGLPPFYTRDREQLFDRIRRGELSYPSYVTPQAKSLLIAMLNRDPNQRLGGGPGDADEIKTHCFFAGIDFLAVSQRRVTPPFKPLVSQSSDVKYFDKEFVDLPAVNSEAGEADQSLGAKGHFDGFTYQAEGTLPAAPARG